MAACLYHMDISSARMRPPKNRSALVTGGSKGIGRAIVLALTSNGVNVAFTYRRDSKSAANLLEEINRGGKDRSKAIALQADVRDFDRAQEVVKQVKATFGQLDILINNAGIVKDSSLMLMNPADWKEVIEINLTGCFNYCRAAIVTFMKQRDGYILNLSSVSGLVGIAGQSNYAASKMGIIGLTRSLAKEVASYGIKVNAIAPGFVQTDIVSSLKPDVQDEALRLIPQKRFASPEEVAQLVIHLLDEKLQYITGQVVVMDGGFSL